MATTTATATTVTAVKFADTLDIVGLSPEQIAKFTEKDFAAFTSQQQSDLKPEQVKLLTGKQLASLPIKLLEPDTIAAITPKEIAVLLDPKTNSNFSIKTLSADQFAALTPDQIKSIPATQFADLTTAQADLLTTDQALAFTSAQIAQLNAKAVAFLNASIIEVLPVAAVTGFTPQNIAGLTTDSISAFTVAQAAVLTAKQITALKPALVAEMEAEDIAALSFAALQGFDKKNIISLALSALTPEQFSALSSKQISLLTTSQVENLDAGVAPLLTSKMVAALSAAQLNVLPTEIIATLEPTAIKGLNVKNIKGLTTEQVAAITPDQSALLTKTQLKAFATDQVAALTVDSALAINPLVLKGVPSTLIEKLNADVFASLSEAQVSNLSEVHIASLTTAQAAKLTGSNLALMKPAILASLKDASISALSADAVGSIVTKQLNKFTATQLESFTPAQAAQLSTEVTDWLLSKKYAIIKSAEANTVGTGGIEVSGTVAGEAVAETITAGAGNDIISTGGTAGDSISSGAGNDTVTITAAATGHAHTIDGGTGTDTLIFDGAAAFVGSDLTRISNFENLKLTGTTTQTFDVGAGTNNAFASLNLDALADTKVLTLTGSVDNLAVSLVAGDLTASGYTGDLIVTATTGSNVIITGSGADSIDGGAGSDEITAGAGMDTIKGGADADTFKFTAGSSGGTPSSTVFDTVTDFVSNTDTIDFTDVALSITATSAAAATGTAQILPTGRAVFVEADDTLQERIVATEAALSPATTATAGKSALFNYGSDSYVFVSDANDGVTSNDTLIKLSGVTGTSLGVQDGNITSVGSYTVATFNGGTNLTAANTVYIVDTAANINAAAATLVTNIAKIDGIIASDDNPIVLTPTQFATAGVPNVLVNGSTTVLASNTATAGEVSALVTDIAKIKDAGVTGTFVLTPAQFATASVVTKLADATATVVADGTNVPTLVANAAKIAAGGLTGTVALTPAQFATTGVTTALANTTATVVADGTNVASLVAGAGKIAAGGLTGSITLTPTEFNTSGVIAALANGSATVNVTTAASAGEITTLTTTSNVAKLASVTGTIASLTDTQFTEIASKLGSVTVNSVDASGASAAETTAIVANAAKIAASGLTSGSSIPLTAAQFATSGGTTGLAAGKATVALTTASNGDESGFITALLASPTKIAAGGVTLGSGGALALTATQLNTTTVAAALGTGVATVSYASGSESAQIPGLVTNVAKIAANGITGTGLSLDEVQFSALRAKLSADIIDVTVDASSATSTDVDALVTGIDRIGTINVSGTLSVTDTQFKALQGKLASGMGTVITVNVASATVDELAAVTANIGKIAAVTNLSLDVAQSATNIGLLLGKAATGSVTVDPTNFDAAQITAINTAATKIATGGITKTTGSTTIPLTATQFATLVNKLDSAHVTAIVDASGASASEIATMTTAANVAKIAASNGVKGTGITLTAAQFNVLDSLLDSSVTVTVNASGSSFADLENLSNNISKVASITGLSLALGTDVKSGGTATENNTITENLLSKATGASVNAAGATTAELSSLFTHIANVSSLSNSDFVVSASQFVTLQSTLPTGTVIDATGATASQLSLIAADIAGGSTKVGSITNLTLSLGAQSVAEANSLLSKAANNSVTTNITGANNINGTDYTATLVTNAAKFATGGLTGSNLSLTGTQFAALATKFASSVTDVIVDAASATTSELAAISSNIARIGLVKNASIVAATQTDTEVENLLSKSYGLDAVINANGASATQANSIATHIGKIAAGGVTGAAATLTVTPTQFTAITAKLTGNATVDATGANATQLSLLSADAKASAITNLTLSVSQSDTEMTALLGKVSAGTAHADLISPSSAQIIALAAASTKLATAGLTGSGYAMDEVQFSTLATKFGTGVTTTVDATSAAAADLVTMSNNISHVGSISNLALTTASGTSSLGVATITDTVTANLLSKAVNATATVEATGASDAEIASLTTYANKIAVDGITGTLAVTDTQFATLHSRLAAAATVTVNAAGATTGELTVLSTNNTKVDTIKNLVVTAANQTDAETDMLLSKSEAAKAKVVATGATATEVASLVTRIGQIDPNGITGVLPVTSAVAAADITTLFGKYADGVATVNATGMEGTTSAQLKTLAAQTGKIATGGISNMTLVAADLNDTQTANLLSKSTGALVTVDATDSVNEVASFAQYIGNIAAAGIGGTLPITAGVAADSITNLFGKYSGATATVNALGMNSSQIANIVTNAAKIGAGALTNATLDEVQFAATGVITALGTGAATVDATGASAANQVILLTDANLAKIAAGGLSHLSVDLAGAGVTAAFTGVTKATLTAKVTGTLTIAGDATADTVVLTNYTGATSITGNNGADAITAGGGADTFIYTAISTTESGSAVGASATTLPVATTVDTITDFTTGVDKIALPVALGAASASTLVPTNGTPYTTNSVLLEADDFVSVAFGTDAVAANTTGNARFIYDTVAKVLYFDPTGNTAISAAG
ncbi:MAG: hypothetical protein PHC99_07120, partial [Methylococcales bacterium]|nr:hypothetical protein [Methylococcales bacterium]